MSLSHHGSERDPQQDSKLADLMRRFNDQVNGEAKRQYSAGRMGAEDDGDLTYAIATDDRHRSIVIRFGKPVEWIGLGVKEAEELRDQLTERLLALRGVTA